MTEAELLKLFGTGGGFLVVLGAFVWLVRYVGFQLVDAIKGMRQEINDHTAKDLEHHAEVKEAIVRVEGKLDGALAERDRLALGAALRHSSGHD